MTRGEMYWADYGVPYGSEIGFRRPVIIVQDNAFNIKELRTVLVVPLTSNTLLADAPANVFIDKEATGLSKDSTAVVSKTGAIDKRRLSDFIGVLPKTDMQEIEDGLRLIFSLG